jgi:cytochrome c-type biogenesis protein
MGLSITTLGKYFDNYRDSIRIIGGILVIVFGLHISGIIKIKYLYYEKRFVEPSKLGSGASSILLGMAFATGWTPCLGPILTSILFYASSMSTIYKGVMLLAAYSLGLAVPFIFTAIAVESFSKYFRKITKYMTLISAVSGLLIVGVGLIIIFDRFLRFSSYFNFFNF